MSIIRKFLVWLGIIKEKKQQRKQYQRYNWGSGSSYSHFDSFDSFDSSRHVNRGFAGTHTRPQRQQPKKSNYSRVVNIKKFK